MKVMLSLGIAVGLVFSTGAFAQQPKAGQQLQKANEGKKASDHVFDGRKSPPPAVQAAPAAKPSPAGLPVQSTAGNPGFKPQQPSMKMKEPPAPPKR